MSGSPFPGADKDKALRLSAAAALASKLYGSAA